MRLHSSSSWPANWFHFPGIIIHSPVSSFSNRSSGWRNPFGYSTETQNCHLEIFAEIVDQEIVSDNVFSKFELPSKDFELSKNWKKLVKGKQKSKLELLSKLIPKLTSFTAPISCRRDSCHCASRCGNWLMPCVRRFSAEDREDCVSQKMSF
jgi:hypothetical protein